MWFLCPYERGKSIYRSPPADQSSERVRNTAIGFIGGALFAMAVIFIVFKLDVLVRSKERLEECFDIPVIGVIPRLETMD